MIKKSEVQRGQLVYRVHADTHEGKANIELRTYRIVNLGEFRYMTREVLADGTEQHGISGSYQGQITGDDILPHFSLTKEDARLMAVALAQRAHAAYLAKAELQRDVIHLLTEMKL